MVSLFAFVGSGASVRLRNFRGGLAGGDAMDKRQVEDVRFSPAMRGWDEQSRSESFELSRRMSAGGGMRWMSNGGRSVLAGRGRLGRTNEVFRTLRRRVMPIVSTLHCPS